MYTKTTSSYPISMHFGIHEQHPDIFQYQPNDVLSKHNQPFFSHFFQIVPQVCFENNKFQKRSQNFE